MSKRLVIIGAGAAGTAAALEAARAGAEVTLVEKGTPGGNWLAADLMPSKVYLTAAQSLEHAGLLARKGMAPESSAAAGATTIDLAALLRWKEDAIAGATAALARRLVEAGVRLVPGVARLAGAGRVEVVGGKASGAASALTLEADVTIVATGSRPRRNPSFNYDGKRVFTTKEAFAGGQPPGRVLIVGSGPSGVEFAYLYHRLGVKVTFLVSRGHLLPHEDDDVAAVVQGAFLERGMEVFPNTRVVSLDAADGGGVLARAEDGREFAADAALVSIGQEPYTGNLGLESVGAAVDQRGRIPVDQFQRTPAAGVYAAGDVTGRFMLASVAARQGAVAARHALGLATEPVRYDAIASGIFAEPQVCSVGVTEGYARWKQLPVKVYKAPFAGNLKAGLEERGAGFIKVVTDAAGGRVLGGSVVGPEASEVVATLSLAVRAQATVEALREAVYITPSFAEALGRLEVVG